MTKEFKCPYCFEKIQDTSVLFRLNDEALLEAVAKEATNHKKRLEEQGIPFEKEPFEKAGFIRQYDEILIDFWGTADKAPKEVTNPVLNPSNANISKFLVKGEDGSFLHQVNGFVDCIKFNSNMTSKQLIVRDRICPKCHNALPDGYGKYPTNIISIIGITGSGKTVYISKLLEQLKSRLIYWGISALPTKSSADFISKNRVLKGQKLPESTSSDVVQAPIYYELEYFLNGKKETRGLMIYDIAGENFKDGNDNIIRNYGKHIKYTDGFIVLLDPLQFPSIAKVENKEQSEQAFQALQMIKKIINPNNEDHVEKPIAVCMSKVDIEVVQDLFAEENAEIISKLNQDCQYQKTRDGDFENTFLSEDYNVISKAGTAIIRKQDDTLHGHLRNLYSNFNYFALTSLGCGINDKNQPESEVNPRRILEPLLWLFTKFGYLKVEGELHNPAKSKCPQCQSIQTERKDGEKNIEGGFLCRFYSKIENTPLDRFIKKEKTNMICNVCRYKWNNGEE